MNTGAESVELAKPYLQGQQLMQNDREVSSHDAAISRYIRSLRHFVTSSQRRGCSCHALCRLQNRDRAATGHINLNQIVTSTVYGLHN